MFRAHPRRPRARRAATAPRQVYNSSFGDMIVAVSGNATWATVLVAVAETDTDKYDDTSTTWGNSEL